MTDTTEKLIAYGRLEAKMLELAIAPLRATPRTIHLLRGLCDALVFERQKLRRATQERQKALDAYDAETSRLGLALCASEQKRRGAEEKLAAFLDDLDRVNLTLEGIGPDGPPLERDNPREVAAREIEKLSDEEVVGVFFGCLDGPDSPNAEKFRRLLADLLRAPNPCDELTREAERLGMYDQGKGPLP